MRDKHISCEDSRQDGYMVSVDHPENFRVSFMYWVVQFA